MNLDDFFFLCVYKKIILFAGWGWLQIYVTSYAHFFVCGEYSNCFSYVVVIFCADSFDTECPQTYRRKGKT